MKGQAKIFRLWGNEAEPGSARLYRHCNLQASQTSLIYPRWEIVAWKVAGGEDETQLFLML